MQFPSFQQFIGYYFSKLRCWWVTLHYYYWSECLCYFLWLVQCIWSKKRTSMYHTGLGSIACQLWWTTINLAIVRFWIFGQRIALCRFFHCSILHFSAMHQGANTYIVIGCHTKNCRAKSLFSLITITVVPILHSPLHPWEIDLLISSSPWPVHTAEVYMKQVETFN